MLLPIIRRWLPLAVMCALLVTITLPVATPAQSALATTRGVHGDTQQSNTGDGVFSKQITQQETARALTFWTPERMREAIPDEFTLSHETKVRAPISEQRVSKGTFKAVPPIAPRNWQMNWSIMDTASFVPGFCTKVSCPFYRHEVLANYARWPYSTFGRIFYTDSGGGYHSCSGSTITSKNKSVVITAGHCVNSGGSGSQWFINNWVFIPAYKNNQHPLGIWAARTLLARNEWINGGRWSFDFGMAIMKTNVSGTPLTDIVGSQGLTWNRDRNQNFFNFGYPGAPPFDGNKLYECDGPHGDDTPDPYHPSDPWLMGMGCDMTEGSSGGPWLIQFGSNGGYINGDTHGSGDLSSPIESPSEYSPYFGDSVYSLYNTAQNK